MPSYADITTNDRNVIKRWLQNRRLDDALWWVSTTLPATWAGRVLDYGGGDGALCARILRRFPAASVTCFEPSAQIRAQAIEATRALGVAVIATPTELDPTGYDLITCCEVFEHLPAQQTIDTLDHLARALKPQGRLVIGVPNEIFLVGLAKGLFRMARRRGEYDARWGTVLAAACGRPKADRPHSELDGLPFIYPHTGFDYRRLVSEIPGHGPRFIASYASPLHRAPRWANAEVYLVYENVAAGQSPDARLRRVPAQPKKTSASA